jgi:hypothetical protein
MKCAIRPTLETSILATALALAAMPTANAKDKSCSNSTLNGTYGALIRGSASNIPFAALDVVTADGNGNLSGTGTIAYNGAISQNVPISASYSINSDCSGSVRFSSGTTQSLVITRSGDEVQFIRTDNLGSQVTGDAKRVGERKCSNKSLRGSFGATLGGDVSGLPFAVLDLVTAGGDGSFSGSGIVSFNNAISEVTFTATYSINSDCSGSIAFSTGATQDLVVVGKGSEVRFIRTDEPNAVVTGIAKSLEDDKSQRDQ